MSQAGALRCRFVPGRTAGALFRASGPGRGPAAPPVGHGQVVRVFAGRAVKALAVAESTEDGAPRERATRPKARRPRQVAASSEGALSAPANGNGHANGHANGRAVGASRLEDSASTAQYNASLEELAAEGKFKMAMLIYNEMQRNGVPPDSMTFECLLRSVKKYWANSKRGRTERAENATRIWDMMQESGARATTGMYNELINCYGRAGRFQLAREAFDSMEYEGCTPDEKTYNSLISAYGRAGRWGDALDVFEALKASGQEPGKVTYSAIITALKQSGQQEAVMDIIEEMEARGVTQGGVHHANLKPTVALIRAADTALAVLKVVRERRREFQHDAIAVAMNRIAHLLLDNTWSIGERTFERLQEEGGGGAGGAMRGSWERHVAGVEQEKRVALGSSEFQTLVEMADAKLEGFSPLSLANLSWALGRLGHNPGPGMLGRMAGECRKKMGSAQVAELTMMVWGFAALGASPGNALVSTLWRSAIRSLDTLDAQALSNILWASAVLRHDPGRELMEAWMEAMPRVLKYSNAFDMGNFFWGLASLGHKPGEELTQLLLDRMETMMETASATHITAGELVNVLWALAVLDVRYEGVGGTVAILGRTIGERLTEGWDGVDDGQQVQLYLALQALEGEVEPMPEVEAVAQDACRAAVAARAPPSHADDVGACLAALGHEVTREGSAMDGTLPLDFSIVLEDGRKVGVIVEPEESHSSNMKRPMGGIVLRNRLLARCGYIVLSLPHHEYGQAAQMGEGGREWLEGHLERKLKKVVGWADENDQEVADAQASAQVGARAGARANAAVSGNGAEGEGGGALAALRVPELKALAKAQGLAGAYKMTRSELLAALGGSDTHTTEGVDVPV